MPQLPPSVASILKAAAAAGFSGTRRPASATVAAVQAASSALAPGVQVFTGCAAGVDALSRSLFPSAAVFAAAQFGRSRGSFAARSIACVQAVRAAGGLWLAFPSGPCPAGLLPTPRPGQAFGGFGSGTWASLALAAGLGLPCLVFCPSGVSVPSSWGFRLVAQSYSGTWFHFPGGAAPGLTPALF